jgi:hypothetical protein
MPLSSMIGVPFQHATVLTLSRAAEIRAVAGGQGY